MRESLGLRTECGRERGRSPLLFLLTLFLAAAGCARDVTPTAMPTRPALEPQNVAALKLMATLSGHEEAVRSVAFSPDGRLLASGSFDGTIRLRALPGGDLIRTFYAVAFSPMGRMLATAGADGGARLWQVDERLFLRALPEHPSSVLDVEFSPDGQLLATASADGIVRLWGITSGN